MVGGHVKRKMEQEHQTTGNYRRGGDQVLCMGQLTSSTLEQLSLRGGWEECLEAPAFFLTFSWTRKGRGVSRKGCAKVWNSNFPKID